jgi:hypothetical protein
MRAVVQAGLVFLPPAWDSSSLEQAFADSHAWSNLVDLERKLNSDPGLVNGGTHIILAARR